MIAHQYAVTPLGPWLEQSPVIPMEDPLDDLFCDEVTFYGGSYRVLPGSLEGGAYIFRRLAAALFWSEDPAFSPSLRASIERLVRAVLRLSEGICELADIRRGTLGGDDRLVVPSRTDLDNLKAAVELTHEDLAGLVGGAAQELEPFTQQFGQSADLDHPGGVIGNLHRRPLVQTNTHVVVAAPHALLMALLHEVQVKIVAANRAAELANWFRRSVFVEATASLEQIGCPAEIGVVSGVPHGTLEGLFRLDTDKAIYLQVRSETLNDFNDELHREWLDETAADEITARITAVEGRLFEIAPAINELMHLIVIQGITRSFSLSLPRRMGPAGGHVLTLRATDLEVVALLDQEDPLCLWYFAETANRIRMRSEVVSLSALDEYALYRVNPGYYHSDESVANLIVPPTSGGSDLRGQIARRLDRHGVRAADGPAWFDVALLHGEQRIPIYARVPIGSEPPRLLVQTNSPAWIVASPDTYDDSLRTQYAQFVDMVAFWFWQVTASQPSTLSIHGSSSAPVVIELQLPPAAEWKTGPSVTIGRSVEWHWQSPLHLVFAIGPSILRDLGGADNAGERSVVQDILSALSGVGFGNIKAARIQAIVDHVAPIGPKRRLLVGESASDPRLPDPSTARFRGVQGPVEARLLDDLGAFLIDDAGYGRGAYLEPATKNEILNQSTAFCFQRLEALVATLVGSQALDWLVAFHEGIIGHETERKLAMPHELVV